MKTAEFTRHMLFGTRPAHRRADSKIEMSRFALPGIGRLRPDRQARPERHSTEGHGGRDGGRDTPRLTADPSKRWSSRLRPNSRAFMAAAVSHSSAEEICSRSIVLLFCEAPSSSQSLLTKDLVAEPVTTDALAESIFE
ncbi:hypothetical protein ACFQYP_34510 [Nonomuraea antimicrobica]